MQASLSTTEAVRVYRELARRPSVARAWINSAKDVGTTERKLAEVNSLWSQRDIETSKTAKFIRSHRVDVADGRVASTEVCGAPVDTSTCLLQQTSPSGNFSAILRLISDKQYLEVWSRTCKLKNVELQVLEKHGKVYDDGTFGCFQWSPCERYLLYVAEKKMPKMESFFKRKDKEKAESDDAPVRGEEFVYQEDWGEGLVSKHRPVLCIFDVEEETTQVLTSVPDEVSPGQAVWCPDGKGVVFVGWWHVPFRLGIIYCTNRRSALFRLDLEGQACEQLTGDGLSVRCPRFSPDGSRLVFLQNPAGGPHNSCSQVAVYLWKEKTAVVVTDIVRKASGDSFPGIYAFDNGYQQCWAADSRRVVLNTYWRSKMALLVINTDTKEVKKLSAEGDDTAAAWRLLDIRDDLIVAACCSPNTSQHLRCAVLPPSGQEHLVKWETLDDVVPTLSPPVDHKVITFTPVDGGIEYEAILMRKRGVESPPMIVWPHGGPHSVFSSEFLPYIAGFCQLGFAVLLVNYRGSLGFGQDFVESLPGKVGSQDVSDVHHAVKTVVVTEGVNKDKLLLCGGSHGGFLVTHLVGQFPDTYKACVARNPVTNIASMFGTTDIPDWCCVEAGLEPDFHAPPSPEVYSAMLTRSPMYHADKIKTPTMVMLGEVDRRVPPPQGKELHRLLKTRGVPTRLLVYPDNSHPISKVDAEADAFVNIYKWFTEHMAN
ncbi:acylamino-acid-releasing enzyme-like [Branchiostoma lanceolatum]|uniref:acylamino-acid-releasing enzyme-like n=1 Tax=Branchiostoma lanceolatum TaxID=7740 RepID=UPI00345118C9